MTSTTFEIVPVTGRLGAEVHGLDFWPLRSTMVTVAGSRRVQRAPGLFFRDQHLTPEQQIAFGRRSASWGAPVRRRQRRHPEIIDIVTEPDDRVNFGGGWHSDVTFLPEPDLGSILYAVELPRPAATRSSPASSPPTTRSATR